MKLKKYIFLFFIFLIILTPFLLWFIWKIIPSKSINILIMDKTVTSTQCLEHRAFFGVLIQQKYFKADNEPYSWSTDYFGFTPQSETTFSIKDIEKCNEKQLDSIAEFNDMTYYTDTYGLTKNEWSDKKELSAFSMKLYGGLDENDVSFLNKMKEKNKLIIAEFNFLAKPTSEAIRVKAEDVLSINWTGWTGKYFKCLDTNKNEELPVWIPELYKKNNNNSWPFKASGIIFVNNFTLKIVVLENIKQLNFAAPKIVTSKSGQDIYEVPYETPYSGWFDITYPTDTSQEIISFYRIETNKQGDSAMANNKLPRVFPAVIKNKKETIFYFCGDFCDNPSSIRFMKFAGIACFERFLSDKNNLNDPSSFYWNFYFPMMKSILKEYYKTLNKD